MERRPERLSLRKSNNHKTHAQVQFAPRSEARTKADRRLKYVFFLPGCQTCSLGIKMGFGGTRSVRNSSGRQLIHQTPASEPKQQISLPTNFVSIYTAAREKKKPAPERRALTIRWLWRRWCSFIPRVDPFADHSSGKLFNISLPQQFRRCVCLQADCSGAAAAAGAGDTREKCRRRQKLR